MNEANTVRVTGRGQLKLRPDLTRIGLSLEGLDPDYGEALRRSAEDTEALRSLLGGFGFDRSELKTLSFGVETEYEGYQEDGIYKQRFAGYRYRHQLKLEFPSDNARLGRVLYALGTSPIQPELRLSYTLSDPEAAKNALLDRAVADARAKAEVLARAALVTLGTLRSIDYSWGELDVEVGDERGGEERPRPRDRYVDAVQHIPRPPDAPHAAVRETRPLEGDRVRRYDRSGEGNVPQPG